MAIGLGLLFGIVLPINFSSPYKALNIATFWRKWHITLGRFLKHYVYTPLGGSRVPLIFNLRNLFLVFLISGIWHGAGWGFIIWGSIHGLSVVIHKLYTLFYKKLDSKSGDSVLGSHSADFRDLETTADLMSSSAPKSLKNHESPTAIPRIREKESQAEYEKSTQILESQTNSPKIAQNKGWYLRFMQTRIYILLCWFLTFNFVNIAWVFFRAENLQGAVNLLQGMFFGSVVLPRLMDSGTVSPNSIEVWGWVFLAFILALVCKNSIALSAYISKWRIMFAGVGCAICLLKIIGDSGASSPFLYFNF